MPKRPLVIPDRSQITDDTPLRLAVAAALAYPDGSMTAAGLRRERDAGRLVTELTANKEFTTLGDIVRMREMCRGRAKASGSRQDDRTTAADAEDGRRAHAAALLALDRLKAIGVEKRNAERAVRQKERGTIRVERATQAAALRKQERKPKG